MLANCNVLQNVAVVALMNQAHILSHRGVRTTLQLPLHSPLLPLTWHRQADWESHQLLTDVSDPSAQSRRQTRGGGWRAAFGTLQRNRLQRTCGAAKCGIWNTHIHVHTAGVFHPLRHGRRSDSIKRSRRHSPNRRRFFRHVTKAELMCVLVVLAEARRPASTRLRLQKASGYSSDAAAPSRSMTRLDTGRYVLGWRGKTEKNRGLRAGLKRYATNRRDACGAAKRFRSFAELRPKRRNSTG